MTDAASSPTIRLVADGQRRQRYPDRVWVRGTLVEILTGAGAAGHAGTVFDVETWPGSTPSDGTVMLSLDALAGSMRDGDGGLPATDWLPLLPVDFSADVGAARQHVLAGNVGAPSVVDVTIPVGLPPAGEWDVDHVSALTELEALVFGMRVAEVVADGTVETSTMPGTAEPVRTALHRLGNGVRVVHHIVPADCTPATAFEARVLGTSGHVVLRQPFAPGSVGVWRADGPGYTFPAVREAKDDVQAPDSAGGGWEMTRLLNGLVTPDPQSSQLRDHAVRLVRHALEHTPGGDDDH